MKALTLKAIIMPKHLYTLKYNKINIAYNFNKLYAPLRSVNPGAILLMSQKIGIDLNSSKFNTFA
jgi:hypothetical protein